MKQQKKRESGNDNSQMYETPHSFPGLFPRPLRLQLVPHPVQLLINATCLAHLLLELSVPLLEVCDLQLRDGRSGLRQLQQHFDRSRLIACSHFDLHRLGSVKETWSLVSRPSPPKDMEAEANSPARRVAQPEELVPLQLHLVKSAVGGRFRGGRRRKGGRRRRRHPAESEVVSGASREGRAATRRRGEDVQSELSWRGELPAGFTRDMRLGRESC